MECHPDYPEVIMLVWDYLLNTSPESSLDLADSYSNPQ